MFKDLTLKETEKLRALYWKLKDAQGELNRALNDTAIVHGCDIKKEQWNVTDDFKRLQRVN